VCGRYVVAYDPETLVSGFSVLRVPPFPKRWNVAPTTEVPVVYENKAGERVAELMRWGLVPSWARDASGGARLNNARSDGVFDKPSFRQAIRRRRCLLPASGFYEWQPVGKVKQPWYCSAADGSLLAMAGLFEAWRPAPDADWLLTCCVITTASNALMAPIHDRMPVLIARAQWATWLAREVQAPEAIAPLLVTPPAEGLRVWPVSRAVSRSSAEGPMLVEPIPG
jgi:putative SOS response-associated peptidase YedK